MSAYDTADYWHRVVAPDAAAAISTGGVVPGSKRDAQECTLDQHTRLALLVPPDGLPTTCYYLPEYALALTGLSTRLYALVENSVDNRELAVYLENSYTYLLENPRQGDDIPDALRDAILPVRMEGQYREPALLEVWDETKQAPYRHAVYEQPEFTGLDKAGRPVPGQRQRSVRMVCISSQNHHFMLHVARRFRRFDTTKIKNVETAFLPLYRPAGTLRKLAPVTETTTLELILTQFPLRIDGVGISSAATKSKKGAKPLAVPGRQVAKPTARAPVWPAKRVALCTCAQELPRDLTPDRLAKLFERRPPLLEHNIDDINLRVVPYRDVELVSYLGTLPASKKRPATEEPPVIPPPEKRARSSSELFEALFA